MVCPPLAGFCAVTTTLPPPWNVDAVATANAPFGVEFQCIAAEPYAAFLRVGINDNGQEVAYESAVLGRLRRGYRVLQLRGLLGTRIELAYLLVKITTGSEPNKWPGSRQVRGTR